VLIFLPHKKGEHNHNDLEFLISAGLPPAAARECLEVRASRHHRHHHDDEQAECALICPFQRARGDVGRAIEIWTDLQPSWREPTPPAQANTLTSELLASALHQASTQSFARYDSLRAEQNRERKRKGGSQQKRRELAAAAAVMNEKGSPPFLLAVRAATLNSRKRWSSASITTMSKIAAVPDYTSLTRLLDLARSS